MISVVACIRFSDISVCMCMCMLASVNCVFFSLSSEQDKGMILYDEFVFVVCISMHKLKMCASRLC